MRHPWAYEAALRLLRRPCVEIEIARAILRPGDTVLDVGANAGQFTFVFSTLVGRTGSVHAFEPVDETFARLEAARKAWGGVDIIKLNHIALGETEGSAIVYVPDGDLTQASLATHAVSVSWTSAIAQGTVVHQTVPKTTIDMYTHDNHISKVAYIKCDVEGAELNVLKGAQGLLSQPNPPVLLVEVFPDWTTDFGYEPSDLFEYLHGIAGYRIFHVTRDGPLMLRDWSGRLPGTFPDYLNYLCVPPNLPEEKVRELRLRDKV